MAIVTGTVESFGTKWDKYSILVNGTWYSTKMEYSTCKPVKGDVVEFDDGGAKYTQKMKIVSAGGGASESPNPSATGGGAKKGGFPMAVDDTYRSINRQNALTNACNVAIYNCKCSEGTATARSIIELAREFEAYTTGDIERYAAEEATVAVTDAFSPE